MAQAKAPTSSNDDPGTDTSIPDVDEKLALLDDDLNPINPNNDPLKKEEPEDIEEDQEENIEESEGKSPKDDEEEPTEDDEESEPEGYSIDEGVEEEESLPPEEVTPEDQYILDNIKDSAIVIRGTVGDSKEVKEYKVLAPQQLPRGFHFIDDYDRTTATSAFNALEGKASQLQAQYRQEKSTKSIEKVTEAEKIADRSDIARLQKAGDIPLFKSTPDDPNFDGDPGVELVQKILDYKDKLNSVYNESYSKGAAYRHIGFEEAYLKYQKENPDKVNTAQKKEDDERKGFASRTNRPNAGRSAAIKKPKLPAGASSRDLDRYIESLEI